jgi:transposase
MNQGMFSYFQNLQNIQTFRMKRSGFISIDEHISSHCSDNIEGVSYFYSTSHKKPILGQFMISAHYYGTKIEYPVDFSFYRRKEELQKYELEHLHKKKNELFREIVGKLSTLDNCPDTILMDSYYMTKENARYLDQLDKKFVSRIKRNWKGTYNHHSMNMTELCRSIPLPDFHLTYVKNPKTKKVHGYYTAVRNIFFSGIGTLRVVFVDASRFISSDGTLITNDRYLLDNSMQSGSDSGSVTHFHIFVTNQLSESAENILNAYSIRWTIETGYRTLNQAFSLGKCQYQSVALQYCFIGLTFLCYWFLLWLQIYHMPGHRGRISTCFSKIKADYFDYLIDCYEKSRTLIQDLAIKEPYAHVLYSRYYVSLFSEEFCTLEGAV